MKKRFIAVFLIVCLLASFLSFPSFASTSSTPYLNFGVIRTFVAHAYINNPGGSAIPAYRFLSYDPPENLPLFEQVYNNACDPKYVNAIRLHVPSGKYNCHSYAWVSQNVDEQIYWVNDPSNYYKTGNNYVEVTTPMVGDIICYFDDNGTPNNTSDDENLHSGIVIAINVATSNGLCGNSNTVEVESKWGPAGVYRHNGYECPYTDYRLNAEPNANENERAEYVKYYRKTNHSHNFNTYSEDTHPDYHKCICNCGKIIHGRHEWISTPIRPSSIVSPDYVPQYTCAQCGVVTLHPNLPIN